MEGGDRRDLHRKQTSLSSDFETNTSEGKEDPSGENVRDEETTHRVKRVRV